MQTIDSVKPAKSSKWQTIIYWGATGLFGLAMASSALQYLTNDVMKESFVHLGFPSYFRIELAFAKLLGVLVLLIPALPARIKEWAYAGFSITLASAFIAHTSSGDPISARVAPLIVGVILAASYVTFRKRTGELK